MFIWCNTISPYESYILKNFIVYVPLDKCTCNRYAWNSIDLSKQKQISNEEYDNLFIGTIGDIIILKQKLSGQKIEKNLNGKLKAASINRIYNKASKTFKVNCKYTDKSMLDYMKCSFDEDPDTKLVKKQDSISSSVAERSVDLTESRSTHSVDPLSDNGDNKIDLDIEEDGEESEVNDNHEDLSRLVGTLVRVHPKTFPSVRPIHSVGIHCAEVIDVNEEKQELIIIPRDGQSVSRKRSVGVDQVAPVCIDTSYEVAGRGGFNTVSLSTKRQANAHVMESQKSVNKFSQQLKEAQDSEQKALIRESKLKDQLKANEDIIQNLKNQIINKEIEVEDKCKLKSDKILHEIEEKHNRNVEKLQKTMKQQQNDIDNFNNNLELMIEKRVKNIHETSDKKI